MKARRAQWRRIFEEAARSELSTRRFCQEHNVDETQFYYWRRVLATEERSGAAEQPARFVLVRPDEPQVPASSVALELVLGRDWRLQIRPGVDAATLRCVLAALTAQA